MARSALYQLSFAGFSVGRKTTRREFLQVPLAADAQISAQREAATGRPGGGISQPDDGALMMHVSRRAMASQFEIRFPGVVPGMASGHEHDTQLALETLESLESLEEQMSFFRPTSEISRINLLASEGPIEVEPELFQLLCLAKDIWRDTEGAFDITSTPLWQAWGFARRAGSAPTEEQIADALSRVGFQFVELDDQCNTIRFSRPGIQLNLGGIGKGYALDKCVLRLIQGGMDNFLLHAGQSSIFARDSWSIGIPHPLKADRRIAEIRLRNRAIGTSSSRFQSFRHQGKLYGHIIDPRTGRPAEGVLSATVLAVTSALADALSTAFYVLGPEKSLAYCQLHPEVGTVLLTPSSRGGNLEIHHSGLDDCDLVIK